MSLRLTAGRLRGTGAGRRVPYDCAARNLASLIVYGSPGEKAGQRGLPGRAVPHHAASQALVAYTVEFDNEFERRLAEAGHGGSILSLIVWSNVMRFLTGGSRTVRDLAKQSMMPENRVKFFAGCLERWGFITLRPDEADDRPVVKRAYGKSGRMLRDGWGSGRGIRAGWRAGLTEKGKKAVGIWPGLFPVMERRWQDRFGQERIVQLKEALEQVLEQVNLDLPDGLPAQWDLDGKYRGPRVRGSEVAALPVLFSQLLLAFTMEFDAASKAPLILCANIIRVLGEEPAALGDLPHLTGGSPEVSDVGWAVKRYVAVESWPGGKGKCVRLTPAGIQAQRNYHRLVAEIEERWRGKFGAEKIGRLVECLRGLFRMGSGGRALISEGLIPAEGTVRAGTEAPALGRRDLGAAARRRAREMAAQSEAFAEDPANALPHYPFWDMNRGFGP